MGSKSLVRNIRLHLYNIINIENVNIKFIIIIFINYFLILYYNQSVGQLIIFLLSKIIFFGNKKSDNENSESFILKSEAFFKLSA